MIQRRDLVALGPAHLLDALRLHGTFDDESLPARISTELTQPRDPDLQWFVVEDTPREPCRCRHVLVAQAHRGDVDLAPPEPFPEGAQPFAPHDHERLDRGRELVQAVVAPLPQGLHAGVRLLRRRPDEELKSRHAATQLHPGHPGEQPHPEARTMEVAPKADNSHASRKRTGELTPL